MLSPPSRSALPYHGSDHISTERPDRRQGVKKDTAPAGCVPAGAVPRQRIALTESVHVAVRHRRRRGRLLLRQVRDERLRREQQRGDRRRILQRHPLHLRGVDDPRLQHVHELQTVGVEALGRDRGRLHLLHHHAPLEPGVLHDLPNRLLQRPPHDVGADLLVALELELLQPLGGPEQRDPAPSTIVVLSLSTTTFLARPRSSSLMFSSLIPRSSVIALPPVRVAMSSSMAFRRSPKPGAFTAPQFSVPRSLFTTKVASASPSMSSAMMRKGLPARATCSSSGSMSFITLIFFS